jgi:carbon monoxide dehydrogenase subunit G
MRASAEIVVARPMEAVWRWASDPSQWQHWEEQPGEVARGDYEIVESSAPRRQVVRAVSGAHPFEATLELFEHVSGTRVRHTVSAGPEDALARFVFVAAGPLVRRSMRRRIAAQLARLKTMVELEAAL